MTYTSRSFPSAVPGGNPVAELVEKEKELASLERADQESSVVRQRIAVVQESVNELKARLGLA